MAGGGLLSACASARPRLSPAFKPIQGSVADEVLLPAGYKYDVIVRWGESLWSSAPNLDAARLADGVLLEPGAAERQRVSSARVATRFISFRSMPAAIAACCA